jgi:hypothetical protein
MVSANSTKTMLIYVVMCAEVFWKYPVAETLVHIMLQDDAQRLSFEEGNCTEDFHPSTN